ncbi:uncharacterized protein LOC119100152 [Pollicipes pollicipes]|uniref:uncharacterized protein LOC119100152 n=1 Tax=Pollicipes pollicipes TaxID=41117 RepID=UPI00188490F8|nr:uncharacterized protein LOC119100152 [Pollicipes pollicipes]
MAESMKYVFWSVLLLFISRTIPDAAYEKCSPSSPCHPDGVLSENYTRRRELRCPLDDLRCDLQYRGRAECVMLDTEVAYRNASGAGVVASSHQQCRCRPAWTGADCALPRDPLGWSNLC